jgi:macrolide-specific efflux system membrane fusion protein
MLYHLLFLFFALSCQKSSVYPTQGEIVEAVYGLGTVGSEKVFHAKSAMINSVKELYVTEGQDVKKGQPLLKFELNSVLYAPFDGRVTDIDVTIGENLFPQMQLLTVIDLTQLYLSVSLEQQATMRIKNGLPAEISFEFFRNKKLKGQIVSIYPSKEQFIAKVKLEEWPAGVLPGMTADVAFEIDRKKDALLVPVNAIMNGHIQIKRKGQKLKVPVDVGLIDSEKAEILNPVITLEDEIIIP